MSCRLWNASKWKTCFPPLSSVSTTSSSARGPLFLQLHLVRITWKIACLIDSGESLHKRHGSDEVPARLLRMEVIVSVAWMLTYNPEDGIVHQLDETPERGCNAVAERMPNRAYLFHTTLRIPCSRFELFLQKQQASRAEICFGFDLLVTREVECDAVVAEQDRTMPFQQAADDLMAFIPPLFDVRFRFIQRMILRSGTYSAFSSDWRIASRSRAGRRRRICFPATFKRLTVSRRMPSEVLL